MIGHVTLDIGEKALVYNKDGEARIEEGPQRLFLFREKLSMLKCYSASQNQYLIVEYQDGRTEHIKGPCIKHLNKIEHKKIQVEDLISLDANEALIVYTQNLETKNVVRNIRYGPTLYMLGENEWLHKFSWHGTDPSNKTRMVQGLNEFTTLKIIPDQFYYNVDEVRTADDALMRVKLMMFYELRDITKMLNSTQDPMADFINCLTADVIAFAAKKSYEEFIEQASGLNDLKNYPLLMERCAEIGYSVSKVVFRGYFAHDKLQMMHDRMITRRTELKLRYEQEVQEQTLIDRKLQADIDRMEQEQDMELKALIHEQKMEKDRLEHQLNMEREAHEKSLETLKQENAALLQGKIATDEQEADHLKNLHYLNVNLTELLVAKAGKPVKVKSIVSADGAAQVHIHHNDLLPQFAKETNL